ncbi:centrosome-associated protein CEP250-like [Echeneis naucrates]|uniref:centrosome-associated protein CEP250-like n=1 Tax=Echeneis naucrates TaxID=173247 RepID=UPI0011144A22|nr:centrosome-associated protein CEP250-like [Echeneis naucrates]
MACWFETFTVSPIRADQHQYWELRELAQAVIGPLKRGLHSFINVSDILCSVNGDIIHPGSQDFYYIRHQIENMKTQLEISEKVAKIELQSMDEQTERMIAHQCHLVEQKKKMESKLMKLKKQLESNKSSLQNYREALDRERRNLRSAEDTVDQMRQKRDEAETMRNVGIGIMFIPIIGLLPGAVIALASEENRVQASNAVYRAKEEVESCESQVRSYSNKVSDLESQICKAQRDIQEADHQIEKMQTQQQDLSMRRRVVADIQAKLRQAVNRLAKLCLVGNVAEVQTQYLIQLEPLIKVMENMTEALHQITGDELLHTRGIQRLILAMRKNHSRLKELTHTSMSSDEDYY